MITRLALPDSVVLCCGADWHLVDSQSFATCSEKFPSLCQEGGYPNHHSPPASNISKATTTYTAQQLRDVVAFGR